MQPGDRILPESDAIGLPTQWTCQCLERLECVLRFDDENLQGAGVITLPVKF